MLRESIALGYDDNGNMTSLTPPGRPAHGFTYTAVNREEDYAPPQPSPAVPDPRTISTYNGDRQLELVSRPDGKTVDPRVRRRRALADYDRDKLGRITKKTEMIEGVTTVYEYAYDPAGRLWKVWEDAVLVSTYEYDANGNRLKHITPAGETVGVYDDQDRLLSYGATTYTYGENGELETATTGSDVTLYDYDARGNLRSVSLPDGTLIEYLIDGRDRRVGRKVNGVVEKRWVYKDQLNPVAELDAAGNVVAEFVYGTKSNVPDYMVEDGTTYRIVSDHLGSVRLVVNNHSAAIAERSDYGVFGEHELTMGQSMTPYGFAGGLSDGSSQLVRFGDRELDPLVGRWTSRDPIRFDAGGSSLYEYAHSDPINFKDVSGASPGGAVGACYAMFPGLEEHVGRNINNNCPEDEPEDGEELCDGRVFKKQVGKYRGSDGSECVYDSNGKVDPVADVSFNFGPDPFTFTHICKDVLPHVIFTHILRNKLNRFPNKH